LLSAPLESRNVSFVIWRNALKVLEIAESMNPTYIAVKPLSFFGVRYGGKSLCFCEGIFSMRRWWIAAYGHYGMQPGDLMVREFSGGAGWPGGAGGIRSSQTSISFLAGCARGRSHIFAWCKQVGSVKTDKNGLAEMPGVLSRDETGGHSGGKDRWQSLTGFGDGISLGS